MLLVFNCFYVQFSFYNFFLLDVSSTRHTFQLKLQGSTNCQSIVCVQWQWFYLTDTLSTLMHLHGACTSSWEQAMLSLLYPFVYDSSECWQGLLLPAIGGWVVLQ